MFEDESFIFRFEKYNFEEKDLYDMKLTKSKIRDFKINKILKLCP